MIKSFRFTAVQNYVPNNKITLDRIAHVHRKGFPQKLVLQWVVYVRVSLQRTLILGSALGELLFARGEIG